MSDIKSRAAFLNAVEREVVDQHKAIFYRLKEEDAWRRPEMFGEIEAACVAWEKTIRLLSKPLDFTFIDAHCDLYYTEIKVCKPMRSVAAL